jgi:hypothetical protein
VSPVIPVIAQAFEVWPAWAESLTATVVPAPAVFFVQLSEMAALSESLSAGLLLTAPVSETWAAWGESEAAGLLCASSLSETWPTWAEAQAASSSAVQALAEGWPWTEVSFPPSPIPVQVRGAVQPVVGVTSTVFG